MGGNGSYGKALGGVAEKDRTHYDTGYRIDGHKVLVLMENINHNKFIMNSNSENPIYLIASIAKNTHRLVISGIGIYEKHKLTKSIDLKFDSDGNLIPFDSSEKGSHAHNWTENSPGVLGRKRHDESNHLPIDNKYQHLIDKIVDFNKKGHTWEKGQNNEQNSCHQ